MPPDVLLISCRPALCRPDHAPLTEWALTPDFRQQHGIEEWCWPAFDLSVQHDAVPAIAQWLNSIQPLLASTPEVAGRFAVRPLVVVVSPGALELLRPYLPDPWPADLYLGLMGDASAARASRLGIPESALVYPRQDRGESQESAALLQRLAEQRRHAAGVSPSDAFIRFAPVLLLKGNGGNLHLAPALRQLAQSAVSQGPDAGALRGLPDAFTEIEAYRRKPAGITGQQLSGLSHWKGKQPVVCYLTSSEAAVRIGVPVQQHAPGAVHFLATHPKIEAAARAAGLHSVECILPGEPMLRARMIQGFGRLAS